MAQTERRVILLVPQHDSQENECDIPKEIVQTVLSRYICATSGKQNEAKQPFIHLFEEGKEVGDDDLDLDHDESKESNSGPELTKESSIELGRKELVRSYISSCPQCGIKAHLRTNVKAKSFEPNYIEVTPSKSSSNRQEGQKARTRLCGECKRLLEWGKTYLSRSMIRFTQTQVRGIPPNKQTNETYKRATVIPSKANPISREDSGKLSNEPPDDKRNRKKRVSFAASTKGEKNHAKANVSDCKPLCCTWTYTYNIAVKGSNAYLVHVNDDPVITMNQQHDMTDGAWKQGKRPVPLVALHVIHERASNAHQVLNAEHGMTAACSTKPSIVSISTQLQFRFVAFTIKAASKESDKSESRTVNESTNNVRMEKKEASLGVASRVDPKEDLEGKNDEVESVPRTTDLPENTLEPAIHGDQPNNKNITKDNNTLSPCDDKRSISLTKEQTQFESNAVTVSAATETKKQPTSKQHLGNQDFPDRCAKTHEIEAKNVIDDDAVTNQQDTRALQSGREHDQSVQTEVECNSRIDVEHKSHNGLDGKSLEDIDEKRKINLEDVDEKRNKADSKHEINDLGKNEISVSEKNYLDSENRTTGAIYNSKNEVDREKEMVKGPPSEGQAQESDDDSNTELENFDLGLVSSAFQATEKRECSASVSKEESMKQVILIDVDKPKDREKGNKAITNQKTTALSSVDTLVDNNQEKEKDEEKKKCPKPNKVIYFVVLGTGMPPTRVEILKRKFTKLEKYASIATKFFSTPDSRSGMDGMPVCKETQLKSGQCSVSSDVTHLVLDEHVGLAALAEYLQTSSPEVLLEFLCQKKIVVATPKWIVQARPTVRDDAMLDEPRLDQMHPISLTIQQHTDAASKKDDGGIDEDSKSEVKHPSNDGSADSKIGKKRSNWMGRPSDFASIKRVKASEVAADGNNLVGKLMKQQQQMEDNDKEGAGFNNNQRLSKAFDELSRLHRKMPIDGQMDEWRAYTFAVVACRLRHLDFEVTASPLVLKQLSQIRYFGKSVMEKVKEFLRLGYIERSRELQKDPKRIAMRNMIRIWGVGRAKASELITMGYKDIEDVRKGLAEERITLSRNAKLGVRYYEDLLENMDRAEVCAIRDIIASKCQSKYEGSECVAMGSFRRGEESFGDVDVLIVNKSYHETTPDSALHWLRDELMNDGHLAHHLTDIMAGPIKDSDVNQDQSTSKLSSPQKHWTQKHSGVQTYMGIFNSPIHKGKKRRVDIKFYPYKFLPFASIYFTGNTLFNRSIRMYATKVKRMHLSDRGLKPIVKAGNETLKCGKNDEYISNKSLEASSEEDVFEHLGLIYQPPTKRDGFDAVIPKKLADEQSVSSSGTEMRPTPAFNHLNEQRSGSASSWSF